MIKIVYWSGTGNTEKMAKNIEAGLIQSGKEVHTNEVFNSKVEEIINADLIVLGCPSMGAEQLEEDEMRPFVDSLLPEVSGKKVALFGSYGWGDGEWMANWAEEMKVAGAVLVADPLTINEFTDGQDEEICKDYGKTIASV